MVGLRVLLGLTRVMAGLSFPAPVFGNHPPWHACAVDHGSLNDALDAGVRADRLDADGEVPAHQYGVNLAAGQTFRAWLTSSNFSCIYQMVLHDPGCEFVCFAEFFAALVAPLSCDAPSDGLHTVVVASYIEGDYAFADAVTGRDSRRLHA